MTKLKPIIFAILPLIALFLIAEIGLRCFYFQKGSDKSLAVVAAFEQVKTRFLRAQAKREFGELPQGAMKALYSEQGAALLAELRQTYEGYFRQLAEEAKQIGAPLIVLHLPNELSQSRGFYRSLAEKYGAGFVDLYDEFQDWGYAAKLHQDGHPSRFGNLLTARKLYRFLKPYKDHRSEAQLEKRPRLLGDLKPNQSRIWQTKPNMPYRVETNGQGLRMDYDLAFPKPKQRILALGDSYTFGPFLPNHDTYPALLQERFGDGREVVNAGVAGYTISDEVSLFMERARYTEPDLIILQVLENDLIGLMAFMRNKFSREGEIFEPTALEKEFLRQLSPETDKNTMGKKEAAHESAD